MLWSGWTPGAVGAYWIPAFFDSLPIGAVEAARAGETASDTAKRKRKMHNYREGLRDIDIMGQTAIWFEVDDAPLDVQLARVDELEAETGIRVGLLVLSGDCRPDSAKAAGVHPDNVRPGKSVHGYVLLDRLLRMDDDKEKALWTRAIRALCVAMGGDPVAVNVGRLMRLPGAIGTQGGARYNGVRIQPIVRAEDVRYDPEFVAGKLEAFVRDQWGVSVDEGHAALLLAARVHHLAKREALTELHIVADRIAAARKPSKEDEEEAKAALAAYRPRGIVPFSPSSGGTAVSAKPGATTHAYIDLTTKVLTADGRRGTVAEMAANLSPGVKLRVYCPVHGSAHPSASLWVSDQGIPTIRCHSASCDGLFLAIADPSIHQSAPLKGVIWLNSNSSPPTAPNWTTPSIPKESGVYLMSGPCGCEKTQRSVEATHGHRTLIVSPSIRLAEEAASRFGAKSYREVTGDLVDDRVAVCLPSLLRVPVSDGNGKPVTRYDDIVLDELEGLMALIHSPQVMTRTREVDGSEGEKVHVRDAISGPVYYRLQTLCQLALLGGGRILAADAYASERSVGELRRLCGTDTTVKVMAPPDDHEYLAGTEHIQYGNRGEALLALEKEAKAGGCGTVACDSRSLVEAVTAFLQACVADPKDVLAIHRDSEGGVDPSTWDQYRWVVYDQACGTGVSYTGKRLTQAWLLGSCWGPVVTWDMLRQLGSRNRTATYRRSWVRNVIFGVEVRKAEVRRAAMEVTDATVKLTYDTTGSPNLAPVEEEHFDSKVEDRWIRNLRGRHAWFGYWRDLVEQGCLVTEAHVDDEAAALATDAAFKTLMKTLKGDRVDHIVEAERIFADRARELEAAAARGDLDEAKRKQLERFWTLDYWGYLREDLVADTIGTRKMRRRARAYVNVTLVHTGNKDKVRDRERSRMETQDGRYKGQAANDELKARVTIKLLRKAGLDTERLVAPLVEASRDLFEGISGFVTFTMGDEPRGPVLSNNIRNTPYNTKVLVPTDFALLAGGWQTSVHYYDAICNLSELLGLRVPRDIGKHPSKYLGRLLGSLGIKTTRTGSGNSGTRERVIDLDALGDWAVLCSRQYRRALGRTVPPVELLEFDHDLVEDPIVEQIDQWVDLLTQNTSAPTGAGGS